MTKKQPRFQSERNFVRAFFNSDDEWIYEPIVFNLGNNAPKCSRKFATYRPDFLDKRRGVYIEVSLNWQAYLINLPKYTALRMMYPNIRFEIRNPDGTMFEENPIWNGPRVRRFAQLAALLTLNPFTTPAKPIHRLDRYQAHRIKNDPRPLKDIAVEYGISISHVSHIRRGRYWHESGFYKFDDFTPAVRQTVGTRA